MGAGLSEAAAGYSMTPLAEVIVKPLVEII